jgi:hypothetical protein
LFKGSYQYFYCKFDDFKKAIFDFFKNIKDCKAKLQRLISWNFHIPKTKPISVCIVCIDGDLCNCAICTRTVLGRDIFQIIVFFDEFVRLRLCRSELCCFETKQKYNVKNLKDVEFEEMK